MCMCGITMLVLCFLCFFFFKQKTAYEMRISDWSSDVCSSDLAGQDGVFVAVDRVEVAHGLFLAISGITRSTGSVNLGLVGANATKRKRPARRGAGGS